MTRMIFIFLDSSRRQQRVCQVEHRSKQCRRHHCCPSKAIWSGLVPSDRTGDLTDALKRARKMFKSETKKWRRDRNRIARIHSAPAFRAYHKKLLAAIDAKKPEFKFNWKP